MGVFHVFLNCTNGTKSCNASLYFSRQIRSGLDFTKLEKLKQKNRSFINLFHVVSLAHVKLLVSAYIPENIRKPGILWCFQGV